MTNPFTALKQWLCGVLLGHCLVPMGGGSVCATCGKHQAREDQSP